MSGTVALVLGSGGARGYAHIGVIRELERRGYQVTSVAGTSIGALVGGFWAAGKLDVYAEWISQLHYFDCLKLLDVSLSQPCIIKGHKLFTIIRHLIGDITIESLPVSYTAVATNLQTRKEVWFQQGDLVTAMRASSAVPSLFPPVSVNGQLLVDGAVLNPLPMAPSGSVIADIVIAVDLLGEETPAPLTKSNADDAGYKRLPDNWLKKIWPGNKGDKPQDKEKKLVKSMSMFNIFYQSMEIMQESLARYKVAGNPPNILISVPKNSCRFYDFHKFHEVERIGQSLAAEVLDKWESGKKNAPTDYLK
ncbi:MAG: patatin-like phospholipase family protein [Endozoicomonas sp. (ex Botrylloides leachii)]|nr:patatin-like phospholipase family protein [Endozoicomonas sp. (ex Botrylloides leachii)]